MPTERARALFTEFLATAVAERKFSSANLFVQDAQRVPDIEIVVGIPARAGCFDSLNEDQCEKCINEIVQDESSLPGGFNPFMLVQTYEISKWRIDGQDVPTSSRVVMNYGPRIFISTFFQFDTKEQFEHIKRVLADIGICKLDEKHLKAK